MESGQAYYDLRLARKPFQFYFNRFSLALVHSLIVKTISISNNSVKYKYRFSLE